MALSRALIIVALTAALFSTISTATEFVVGDEIGWTTGFDYQAWTADKVFHVGDKLVFIYPTGKHNVFRVNGTDFKNCTVPLEAQGLTSGDDTIVLESPGRKWYLCGVGNHCNIGQKLFITVLPLETESSPPSPSPAPSPSTSPAQHVTTDLSRRVPRKLITLFQQ